MYTPMSLLAEMTLPAPVPGVDVGPPIVLFVAPAMTLDADVVPQSLPPDDRPIVVPFDQVAA